jgi:hypothetical protein
LALGLPTKEEEPVADVEDEKWWKVFVKTLVNIFILSAIAAIAIFVGRSLL